MKKLKKLEKYSLWHLVASVAVAILVLEITGLIFELKYKDRFYPGVIIGGESVGGQTYQAAVDHFRARAESLAAGGLEITFTANRGEKKVIIPMSRTGLTSDTLVEYFTFGNLQGVIDQAYSFGRTGGAVRKFKERFALIPAKRFNFPVAIYDEPIASLLEYEWGGWLVETVPARFSLGGGTGIVIVKEQAGEIVDLEAVMKTVGQKLAALNVDPVNFVARADVPLSTARQLEPFLKLANELAGSTTLVFRYNGYRWKVLGPTLATWLTLKAEGEIGIDQVKLEAFLNKTVVPVIDNPPQNSRFEMRQGELVEISPGRAGKIVDVAKTIENVERIVYRVQKSFAATGNMAAAVAASSPVEVNKSSGVIEVPVVIIDAEPRVTKQTIAQYSIRDLVGVARTSFKGSSNDRRNNIKIGASKLNGLLIAPGEEFSVVDGIGAVTEAEGYAKEYVIKEGQSIKELGGGLCQIATTMFRAVLNTGLPVTERQNHRYVVGYYGPGLDATIYGPHPDLRFVNDTGNYMLLQGKTEGDEVIFEFYGQKDGRRVTISEPEISDRIAPPIAKFVPTYDLAPGDTHCTERARYGLTANVLYSVTYRNGQTKAQNFHSVYVPWQEVCLLGVAR